LDHVLGCLPIAVDDRQHEADQRRLILSQPGARVVLTARSCHAVIYAAGPRGVQLTGISVTNLTGLTAMPVDIGSIWRHFLGAAAMNYRASPAWRGGRLLVSGGCAERCDREVLVEDVLGIVGGFQLAEPCQGLAGERVVQALRALVCLEAEVEAV